MFLLQETVPEEHLSLGVSDEDIEEYVGAKNEEDLQAIKDEFEFVVVSDLLSIEEQGKFLDNENGLVVCGFDVLDGDDFDLFKIGSGEEVECGFGFVEGRGSVERVCSDGDDIKDLLGK